MKTSDHPAWTKQEQDLKDDGEMGQKFLTYFDFWFTTADTMMGENLDLLAPDAMRDALKVAEIELGFLDVMTLGQMLTLAMVHWEHGEIMSEGLTVIEHRVLEQALGAKIAELQKQAQVVLEVADDEEPTEL